MDRSLFIIFALFLPIVYIVWRFVRAYLTDMFRQRLYEIRDAMFDDAFINRTIDPKEEAYRKMRERINNLIRFAHRYYLIDMLVFLFRWWFTSDRERITSQVQTELRSSFSNSKYAEYYTRIDDKVQSELYNYIMKASPGIGFGVHVIAVILFVLVRLTSLLQKLSHNDQDLRPVVSVDVLVSSPQFQSYADRPVHESQFAH